MASSEGNFANFSVAATKGHGMHQTKPFQLVTRATGYWTGETNVEVSEISSYLLRFEWIFFIAVVVVTLSIYSVPSALDVHFSILTFYICSITLFCFFLFSKFILRKWLLAFGKTYSCLACSSLFFPCFPEMSMIFLLCD